jgi:hypothetical protein
MAELAVSRAGKNDLVTLGHVVDPDGTQTWEKKLGEEAVDEELRARAHRDDV